MLRRAPPAVCGAARQGDGGLSHWRGATLFWRPAPWARGPARRTPHTFQPPLSRIGAPHVQRAVILPPVLAPQPPESPVSPATVPRESTMASPMLGFLLDLATRHDARQAAALCQAANVDPAVLADPDGRVPRSAALRLVEQLMRIAPGQALGLRAHDEVHPGLFQVVGFAMMSSATLHQAIERLARMMPLLDEDRSIELRTEGAHYRLIDEGEPVPPPLMIEASMAALLGFCRFLSAGRGLPVLEAEFRHAAPPDPGAYQRLMPGAALLFGRPRFSLLLEGAALSAPLRPVSPVLDQLHVGLADQRLESLRIDHLVSARVQQFIVRHLRERAPTLHEVAAAMLVSPRSLQRQLAREGRPFKQLLDDTRRQLTHQYLLHSPVTLKELAYLLGFGELGSLHRACLRWFGMSPARYRAQRAAATMAPKQK